MVDGLGLILFGFLRDWRMSRHNADRNSEFRVGVALEHPARGRDVGVIPTDRNANVAVCHHQIVGWIEPDPPYVRTECFDPGMRGVPGRPVEFSAGMEEVATDIPGWNAESASER